MGSEIGWEDILIRMYRGEFIEASIRFEEEDEFLIHLSNRTEYNRHELVEIFEYLKHTNLVEQPDYRNSTQFGPYRLTKDGLETAQKLIAEEQQERRDWILISLTIALAGASIMNAAEAAVGIDYWVYAAFTTGYFFVFVAIGKILTESSIVPSKREVIRWIKSETFQSEAKGKSSTASIPSSDQRSLTGVSFNEEENMEESEQEIQTETES